MLACYKWNLMEVWPPLLFAGGDKKQKNSCVSG